MNFPSSHNRAAKQSQDPGLLMNPLHHTIEAVLQSSTSSNHTTAKDFQAPCFILILLQDAPNYFNFLRNEAKNATVILKT